MILPMAQKTSSSERIEHLKDCLSKVANHRDKAAFSILFDHYAPLLRSYSLAREPGAELIADELAQEVMIRVLVKS